MKLYNILTLEIFIICISLAGYFYTTLKIYCSLINLEETLDHDLDAILGELNALENNFGDGDPDISRDSDTSSKASKASSTISSSSTVVQVVRPSTTAVPSKISPFGAIHEKMGVTTIESPSKPSVQGRLIRSEMQVFSLLVS